jgi:hypothetical protein
MSEGGREPIRNAGVASAEEGVVLLDGPEGLAVALTPDAAEATAHSLIAAAAQARNQTPVSRDSA